MSQGKRIRKSGLEGNLEFRYTSTAHNQVRPPSVYHAPINVSSKRRHAVQSRPISSSKHQLYHHSYTHCPPSSSSHPNVQSSDENDSLESTDDDDDEPLGTNHEAEKTGRGRTKMLKAWGNGCIEVQFNEINQPIGENAAKLSSQMGRVVKNGNMFPLTITDWRKMDQYNKDVTWLQYKANFTLNESYKPEFLKKLGNLWKNWKCEVKKVYYLKYRTDAERLANCPDMVEKDQWPVLVTYWSSEDVQRVSEKAILSRGKLKVPQRTGRRSYAVVRDEITKEEGEEPSDYDFWMTTHVGMAKSSLNKKSLKFVTKLTQLASKNPEALKSKEVRDRIFSDFMGPEKPGQMRTYGFGPTPSQINALKSQNKLVEEKVSGLVSSIREGLKEEVKSDLHNVIEEIVRAVIPSLLRTQQNVSGFSDHSLPTRGASRSNLVEEGSNRLQQDPQVQVTNKDKRKKTTPIRYKGRR